MKRWRAPRQQYQRRFGRFERIAAERMRGSRKVPLEDRPEHQRGRIEFSASWSLFDSGERDAIGGRQRVTPMTPALLRSGPALERFVQPTAGCVQDASPADARDARFKRGKTPGSARAADVGIFSSRPDCSRDGAISLTFAAERYFSSDPGRR